jgi:hypothetical protein
MQVVNEVWQSTMSTESPNEKRTPESTDMDPPNEQSPTNKAKLDTQTQLQQVLGTDDIQDLISSCTKGIKASFRQYLEQNTRLPIWEPPAELPEDTRKYLRNLRIPTLSHSSHYPSLLVHNLGKDDPVFLQRVNSLFNKAWPRIR